MRARLCASTLLKSYQVGVSCIESPFYSYSHLSSTTLCLFSFLYFCFFCFLFFVFGIGYISELDCRYRFNSRVQLDMIRKEQYGTWKPGFTVMDLGVCSVSFLQLTFSFPPPTFLKLPFDDHQLHSSGQAILFCTYGYLIID